MSLQIIVGASGSGKSTFIYEKIMQESIANPKNNYFIIVPDQFTMQTQKDLVTLSPSGGIMNIDVLSLNRLAYRIFEETGGNRKPVLDDTGKNLILRKVAADCKDEIPIIGANLDKLGYIHEVKSAISEFMQYGIGIDQLSKLTEYAKQRGALYYKLKDLGILYQGFLKYIKDNYITTEESMDLLAQELYRSRRIKNSVVVFDGFTGFTPIQGKVIGVLMELCSQVIVTVTTDPLIPVEKREEEQNLFFFTTKTIHYLEKLADEHNINVMPVIELTDRPLRRFVGKEELAFLEANLFRYPAHVYEGRTEERIRICGYQDMRQEVKNTCRKIRELIRETDCCYRDIAVITGDLPAYESEIEEECRKYEIPVFMDQTKGILLNPFIEYINAALEIFLENFSYESVFRYLRSGLADFTKDETDILENYILEMGIHGTKSWGRVFAGRTKAMKKKETAVKELELLNTLRERLLLQLSPVLAGNPDTDDRKLRQNTKFTAGELIRRLYEFVVKNRIEQKLADYEAMFQAQENYEKAKEYGQIYRLIMGLFDQIMDLVGEERMTIREFADILEAGFSEIEVGTIPQSVDRVIVGDIERTRLKPVKYLFFLGLNDGYIPRSAAKGGIISDIDREYLSQGEMELAPTPRQQMFIQKFYLYQNMTKPSERLYLSYATMDVSGKSIRPSYLVAAITEMFPACIEIPKTEETGNLYEVKEEFGILLRRYADDHISQREYDRMLTFGELLMEEDQGAFTEQLIQKAFYQYRGSTLEQITAAVLYGNTILSSVSRMEKYAACAYSYFLQYGLSLQEREEYGFKDKDIGTIFHGVLELFSKKLVEKHLTWMNFEEAQGREMVTESLEEFCTGYTDAMLYESASTRYSMQRMQRILNRAVQTISYQLKKGSYTPKEYELSFEVIEDINQIGEALQEPWKMKLRGKIDRVDTFEDENHVYVKIVDYKSGNKDFDLAAFYKGTQLQLVVYMNEAMKKIRETGSKKEPVSAAMLYYHVSDPMIVGEEGMSQESIGDKIHQELRTQGLVNSDSNVISTMDASMTKKSDCIPVEYKADGSFTTASSVMEPKDMKLLSDFADYRLKSIGTSIMKGEIPVNPCTQGTKDSCMYCTYKEVCGFDEKLPGYTKEEILQEEQEELLSRMRQEMTPEGMEDVKQDMMPGEKNKTNQEQSKGGEA